jgi:bacterioferritin
MASCRVPLVRFLRSTFPSQHTTERGRARVRRPQGEGERVEKQALVKLMNEDLGLEYRSIVQYTQHVAIMKGMGAQSIIQELRTHLNQELEHAVTLAEQIDFLGGVPAVTVPPVPSETDTKAALQLDLKLEQDQLQRYRQRIEQATEMSLIDVAEALRPLLTQTQEHVRDLQTALGI